MSRDESVPFKLAFAFAGGLCLAAISVFRTHLDLTGVVVRPEPLSPLWMRLTPLLLACAATTALGIHAAARRVGAFRAAAVRVGLIWAGAAVVLLTASRFFPTFLEGAVVLFPVIGAVAGALTASAMQRGRREVLAAAAWWALALGVGSVVGFYAMYFVGAGTIDAFEALGWPPRAGTLLGRFLAGGLAGWVIGAIGTRSPCLTAVHASPTV